MEELELELEMLRLVNAATDEGPATRVQLAIEELLGASKEAQPHRDLVGQAPAVKHEQVDWGVHVPQARAQRARNAQTSDTPQKIFREYGDSARSSFALSDVTRSAQTSMDAQDASTPSAASVCSEASGTSVHGAESAADRHSATPTNGSSRKKGSPAYPLRSGAALCQYYMKTGKCSYGSRCKFSHPPREQKLLTALNRRDCFDFVHTGECAYGATCKYNHPAERLDPPRLTAAGAAAADDLVLGGVISPRHSEMLRLDGQRFVSSGQIPSLPNIRQDDDVWREFEEFQRFREMRQRLERGASDRLIRERDIFLSSGSTRACSDPRVPGGEEHSSLFSRPVLASRSIDLGAFQSATTVVQSGSTESYYCFGAPFGLDVSVSESTSPYSQYGLFGQQK